MVNNKIEIRKSKIKDFFSSSLFKNTMLLLLFALIFTLLLSSKHFFFKSLIDENNISRKDVYAEKMIEVIDTYKTEQRKKELAQKLDPIMRPAEDMFIINDFDNLTGSMRSIKSSDTTYNEKYARIVSLLDFSDPEKEDYIASYFLNSSDETDEELFAKAKHTLRKVLSQGIYEKDIYNNNITKLINQNTEADFTRAQAKLITGLLEQVIVPNMVLDEEATEKAKKSVTDSVAPIKVIFDKGDKIISQGEKVTKVKRDALLRAGYSIVQINAKGVLGIFALFVIGLFTIANYLKLFEKKFLNRKYISIILTLSLGLTLISVIIPPDWSVYLIPIPAYVIMLAIFTNPRTAFFITVIMTVLIASSLWLPSANMSVFIIIALFAAVCTSKINFTNRFQLIKVGFEISVVMVICMMSLSLLQLCLTDISPKMFIPDIIFGFLNCVFSGIITLGMMPLLENASGIITPFGLSEYGDANQPLLKRLQFEAPGTFSHSMFLSTLAEAAAEAIGANAALARVGSLYHDIGKLKRPLFFIENQNYFGIENPHCKLNPRLSKMVIISHVKDGLELADEYKLPDILKDFIAQHHGTTLVSYFYTQAAQQEGLENVTQDQFRYPGPRPQTKETAIVMIADTVESASRTFKEYSQEELEKKINKLLIDKLNDGQLADCPLSLRDLKTIAETLSKSLRAIHHQRIKYHDNILEELESRAKQKNSSNDKILPENLKPDTQTQENPKAENE